MLENKTKISFHFIQNKRKRIFFFCRKLQWWRWWWLEIICNVSFVFVKYFCGLRQQKKPFQPKMKQILYSWHNTYTSQSTPEKIYFFYICHFDASVITTTTYPVMTFACQIYWRIFFWRKKTLTIHTHTHTVHLYNTHESNQILVEYPPWYEFIGIP